MRNSFALLAFQLTGQGPAGGIEILERDVSNRENREARSFGRNINATHIGKACGKSKAVAKMTVKPPRCGPRREASLFPKCAPSVAGRGNAAARHAFAGKVVAGGRA